MGIIRVFLLACVAYGTQSAINPRYYPHYHLAPTQGWMNDPNGFSIYRGEFHLFYQYNPLSSLEPGIAHWGHAKSKDLFTWQHLPIAMYPDQWYDDKGVFSGSVLVEGNTMYAFYTGNRNLVDDVYDHLEYQVLATSTDGVNFTKLESGPVINDDSLQPDIRDPKVWKNKDTYYMVLGNSFVENSTNYGRALLFTSKNKLNWTQVGIIDDSDGALGYMYECPDIVEFGNRTVFLMSPQGLQPQGDDYANLYQVGYFVGRLDYKTNRYIVTNPFRELDHGHDFYAIHTIVDKKRNRILLVAWLDMWEQNYPEGNDGWTGQMTIPREITLRDSSIVQKPAREIKSLRTKTLYSGKGRGGKNIKLNYNAAEVNIKASYNKDFEFIIESQSNSTNAVKISYDWSRGRVSLLRSGSDGLRRTRWRPNGDKLIWQIFIDSSSIELFCGDGEVTFSSRFSPDGPVQVRIGKTSEAIEYNVIALKRTVPLP